MDSGKTRLKGKKRLRNFKRISGRLFFLPVIKTGDKTTKVRLDINGSPGFFLLASQGFRRYLPVSFIALVRTNTENSALFWHWRMSPMRNVTFLAFSLYLKAQRNVIYISSRVSDAVRDCRCQFAFRKQTPTSWRSASRSVAAGRATQTAPPSPAASPDSPRSPAAAPSPQRQDNIISPLTWRRPWAREAARTVQLTAVVCKDEGARSGQTLPPIPRTSLAWSTAK